MGTAPLVIITLNTELPITLHNAADYWANGRLLAYIGLTNGLSGYRANGLWLGLVVRYNSLV